MPLIKSAIKKMRRDARKRIGNRNVRLELKKTTKKALENPTPEFVNKANSVLDKAVKRGLIHKNTAGRNKASLAKKLKLADKTKKARKKHN
jgi:small subunit ribosomal protein S20